MKTKKIIKMLIVIFLAIGIGGCREDSPLPTPHLPLSLSQEEIWLIKGMEDEVMVFNSNEFSISAEKSGIIATRIQGSKIFIGALTPGEVSLIIIDKKDSSRRAVLKITISPIKFGFMDTQGRMILEANYRYQATKSLHMASSGAERRKQFIKVPLKTKWEPGEAVNIIYKKDEATPEQQIVTTISQFRDSSRKIIYLKTNDGKYIIFPKDGE